MFLSDRDLSWAIERGGLTVEPRPGSFEPSSIELHLDRIEEAKIWDMTAINEEGATHGLEPNTLLIGKYKFEKFAPKFLKPIPPRSSEEKVFRKNNSVVLKPHGFMLWQTKEAVGSETGDYICFIDGKSTKARAGLIVHLTAPTVYPGWVGNLTLELANLGPFDLILKEDDVLTQITVAKVSSLPAQTPGEAGSVTMKQSSVDTSGDE